jgi:hypothetical protein
MILTEKINVEVLKEIVKKINSVPTSDGKNTLGNTKDKYQQSCLYALKNYLSILNEEGCAEITYEQSKGVKTRFGCKNGVGLQLIPRLVRSWIAGDKYDDVDIKSCHPQILKNLLLRMGKTVPVVLEEYLQDKKAFEKKYGLTKNDMNRFINKMDLEKGKKFQVLKELHTLIYRDLLFYLRAKEKTFFKKVDTYLTKQNVVYNRDGKAISHFLQHEENRILQAMIGYIQSTTDIKIGVLCYDGMMLEKNEKINDTFLRSLEEVVKNNTQYDVSLVVKEFDYSWDYKKAPVDEDSNTNKDKIVIDKDFGEKFSKRKANSFLDKSKPPQIKDGKMKEFMEYMNKFVCQFDEPNSYGFRMYHNTKFNFRSLSTLRDRIGACVVNHWNNSDDLLNYIKPNFIIEEGKKDKRYYNQYVRPPMVEPIQSLENSIVFEYLFEIVCNSNKELYDWTLDFITVLLRTGRTKHCLVLMGIKGLGKSFLMILLSFLVGEEYTMPINDINKITNQFNKWMENKILVNIEEVCANVGEYMKLQNNLKTLITEEKVEIIPKGLDGYITESYVNPIISTNFNNPVQATKDNRRFVFYAFSEKRKKDRVFFGALQKEIEDKAEQYRYFFFHRDYKNLEDNRPITEKEREMVDMNMSITDRFLMEEFDIHGDEDDDSRLYSEFLFNYRVFCDENREKALIPKYLTPVLKSFGFTTKKIKKQLYIQGKSLIKNDE